MMCDHGIGRLTRVTLMRVTSPKCANVSSKLLSWRFAKQTRCGNVVRTGVQTCGKRWASSASLAAPLTTPASAASLATPLPRVRSMCTATATAANPPSGSTSGSTAENVSVPGTTENVTVDAQEIEKFSRIAHQWWDLKGDFAPLHAMNPVRVKYIVDTLIAGSLTRRSSDSAGFDPQYPLTGLRILDIGCGGGLLAEALSAQGAEVLGVDASGTNIGIARAHQKSVSETAATADGLPLHHRLTYRHASAEVLVSEGMEFDVVCALEVVEHVSQPKQFLHLCANLTKEGGSVFVSTMARTLKAYLLTVFGAEYVLGMVPRGTHEWAKYLHNQEVSEGLRKAGATTTDVCGMVYNPLSGSWSLNPSELEVNYIMHAIKSKSE